MSRVAYGFVLLVHLVAIGMASIAAQERTVTLIGQTVDEHGEPLSNVEVTLYSPPCRGCIDQVFPVATSNSDGVFILLVPGGLSRGMRLYLEDSVPRGSWSPFEFIPVENVAHLQLFRGIPFGPGKTRSQLDLGRLVVKLRYAEAKFDLESLLGAQFVPRLASSVRITVRDFLGNVITNGYLPDRAFDATHTSVILALPYGRWFVRFSLGEGPQRINSPQVMIDIDKARNATISVKHTSKFKPARRSL